MRQQQVWEVERDRSELLGRLRDAVWDTFLKQGKTPAAIRELHDCLGLAIEEVLEDYEDDAAGLVGPDAPTKADA